MKHLVDGLAPIVPNIEVIFLDSEEIFIFKVNRNEWDRDLVFIPFFYFIFCDINSRIRFETVYLNV